jgi:hypothetical protein
MLEEQITALQTDVEDLQGRLAEAESLLATRTADLTRARQELEQSKATLSQRDAEAEGLRAEIAAAREQGTVASQRYREAVLSREPELPADLVRGETVEEIDAAVERARQTVSQVRQHIEAQAQASRVPAGAPVRGAPDTSALSPAEKIRLGLQQGG